MTEYEYHLVGRDQAERLAFAQDMINEMGSQGYRLTIVSEWFFVFERDIPEDVIVEREAQERSRLNNEAELRARERGV
jgi:hypothetical protein